MAAETKSSPLAVPSVLYVAPRPNGGDGFILHRGGAAGWRAPQGIRKWENEVSLVKRGALTEAIRKELGLTMPEEQIAAAKMPYASKAAAASPLVGVASALKDKLTAKGVRVHTVGCDRISGGFYYFAEGGSGDKVSVQGDLIEMLGPSLEAGTSNADLEVLLDGLIDRVLRDYSNGELSEQDVELAAALPKAAADGSGLSGIDMDGFEKEAAKLAGSSDKFMNGAKDVAAKLAEADKGSADKVSIPLFGEAKRHALPALEIEVGGQKRKLAARHEWVVTGAPKLDATPAPAAKAEAKAEPKKEAAKAATPKPADAKPGDSKKEPAKAEAKPAAKAEEKPKAEAKPVEKKEEKKEEKKAEPKVEAKAEPKPAEKPAEKEEKKAEAKAEAKPAEKEKKAEAKAEKKEEKAEKKTEKKAEAKGEKKADEKKSAKAVSGKASDEITEKTRGRASKEMDEVPKGGTSPVVWFIVAAVIAAVVWAAFFRH